MQFSDSKMKWWVRAQDSVAQGALTNSKHPDSHVFGVYPTHITGGSQGWVFGTDGTKYVDYICGLGSNLFGYSHPSLIETLTRHMHKGFSHSLPTTDEVETAEALKAMLYFVDKFKFLKSGSAACTAAIKMARAYTGRLKVLSDGYHGHEDEFVSLTTPALGVHRCTDIFKYSDDTPLDDVAAVIIEPVITKFDDERIAWLQRLRDRCTKSGTILIFDEIITGFRFDKHAVALAANIYPDLILLGKAIANGLPLAAVGGKAPIMDCGYFVSSTYAGETLSLASCRWTVDMLLNRHNYKIDRLKEQGEQFIKRFNEMASPYVGLEAYPTRGVFTGEPLNKALFFQEAVKAGFLCGPSWFYSFANCEFDYQFFEFLKSFVSRMRLGQVKLQGAMPKSPFAQRVRDGSKN